MNQSPKHSRQRTWLTISGLLLALACCIAVTPATRLQSLAAVKRALTRALLTERGTPERPERPAPPITLNRDTVNPVTVATTPELKQSVIAGGGGVSANGNIRLEDTVGQSITNQSSGGTFSLSSGFWPGTDCLAITFAPALLPDGTVGSAYSQTFTAHGANSTLTFTLDSGTLPPGLSLSPAGVIAGIPISPGASNFTIKVTDGKACAVIQAYTLLINTPPVSTIRDPFGCTGPGDALVVTFQATNAAPVAQTVMATATVQPGLLLLAGTCATNVGTCMVNTSTVTLLAPLGPGQTATLTYQVQLADGVVAGTTLCIATVASFNGGPLFSVEACAMINCPAVGPGGIFPAASEASDQAAGSVLIYNIYTSGATTSNTQNTRVNITNVHPILPAFVHLFFVSEGCSVADSYLCLTGNQTSSFLSSDLDPGTTGYIVAIAVNAIGCPANFNYLIGDEYVKFTTGHAANLGAEAISALAGGLPLCDGNSVTAQLDFNGISYDRVSHVLALDNIGSRADGNDTLLILNRIGGNLGTGAGALGTVFGIFYDDAENALSFTISGGHQFRSSLTNATPRITPRFETFIPAGRTGWFKLWPTTELWGMTGAAINFNPNAAASAGAFNQGHNLHKLRLTDTANYVMPVFQPSC